MTCSCRRQPYGLINVARRDARQAAAKRAPPFAADCKFEIRNSKFAASASHSPMAYRKRMAGPSKKLPCRFAQRQASNGSPYIARLGLRRSYSATQRKGNDTNQEKTCGRASQ